MPPAKVSPRPTTSASSVTGSVAPSTARASRFDNDDVTMEEVHEYMQRPHHSWDSAVKEMARIETKAQISARLKQEWGGSDTGSCASGVSAYSVASTSTTRSAVSAASSRPARGRMAMLPLGARANTAREAGSPANDTVAMVDGSAFGFAVQGVNGTTSTASGAGPSFSASAGPRNPSGRGASNVGPPAQQRGGGTGRGGTIRTAAGPAGGASGARRVSRGDPNPAQSTGGVELSLQGRPAHGTSAPPPPGAKFAFTNVGDGGAPVAAPPASASLGPRGSKLRAQSSKKP